MTIMDTKGSVLARVGRESYGGQSGRFYSPHGIAVDSRGDTYVRGGLLERLRQQDGAAAGTTVDAEAGEGWRWDGVTV